jgi:hypothetical protein
MKYFLPACVLLLAMVLTGCTAPLEIVTKRDLHEPYKKVLLMYVEGSFTLYALDSLTYNTALRGNFNNLDNLTVRKGTENNFKDQLSSGRTIIIGSSEFFDVNKDITYSEFTAGLKTLGIEAVLLVNRQTFGTIPVLAKNGQTLTVDNNGFRLYLIDLKDNQPVWLAQASYYYTSQVAKNLIKGGTIADPLKP